MGERVTRGLTRARVRETLAAWLRPADLTPEAAEAIARGIYPAPPAPRATRPADHSPSGGDGASEGRTEVDRAGAR